MSALPDPHIAEVSGQVYRAEAPFKGRDGIVNWIEMRARIGEAHWRVYIESRRFLRQYGIRA
jgi:hypothetical protein